MPEVGSVTIVGGLWVGRVGRLVVNVGRAVVDGGRFGDWGRGLKGIRVKVGL